jgi:hypothetical protein
MICVLIGWSCCKAAINWQDGYKRIILISDGQISYPYSYRCSTIRAITGLVVCIIVQIIVVRQPHKDQDNLNMQLCVAAMQDIPSSNRKDLVLFGSTCMIRLLEQCTAHIHVVHSLTT